MLNLQNWNRTNLHLSIAYVLWRRRWYLLALMVLGAAGAGGWAVLEPKTYRASALVLVEPQKVPEKYVSSAVSTDVQDRLASISQQILSNTRLQKIIDDFQLYRRERSRLYPEEILELMRKRITIKLEKGWTQNRPGAFHVDYEGTEPGVVAEVTNRLVSLFLEENLRERELSAEGTSDFLEGQLQAARLRLQELETKVANYKIAHIGSLPGQEGYLNGAIARLQQELQYNDESVAREKASYDIINVGNFAEKRKNQEALLPFTARHRVAFIGAGPRLEEIKRSVPEADQDRALFLGFKKHEGVFAALKQARLMVHTASMDGLPRATLEAMACGVPVVARRSTISGGIPLDAGFLVSDEALPLAVDLLLGDDDLRIRMGYAARRHVEKFHGRAALDRTAAAVLKVLG